MSQNKNLRKVLFIDGSNLYHSMKDNDYDPNNLHFLKFCEKISREEKPVVRYYTAPRKRQDGLRKYVNQQNFHEKIKGQNPNLSIYFGRLQSNHRIKDLYDNAIMKSFGFDEETILKIHTLMKALKLHTLHKEKGVDVKIAVDLIDMAQRNEYDIAILVSGDADITPSVKLARREGKKIINAHFYKCSSSELRMACNSHFVLAEKTFEGCWIS
ncbi:MAG: NYN domain-containing protein [Candidatus Diapherotrites archaeon]